VSERRGSLLARYSSKNAIGAVPAPDLALVGDGPGADVAGVRSDDSVRPIEKTREVREEMPADGHGGAVQ
jgi:hypothetical protein